MHAPGWKSEVYKRYFSTRYISPALLNYEFKETNDPSSPARHQVISDGDSIRVLQFKDSKLFSATVKQDFDETMTSVGPWGCYQLAVIINLLMPEISTSSPSILDLKSVSVEEQQNDSHSSDYFVKGQFGKEEYTLLVEGGTNKIRNFNMETTETEESRLQRVKSSNLIREYAPEKFEDFTWPEDLCISLSKSVYFTEAVFNDSLTVDSIIESH